MGRIGCNIGEPDNDLGYGDYREPTLAEVYARDQATAAADAASMEAFRQRCGEMMLEMLRDGRANAHPPAPKGVWR